jgi:acyl-CoA thioester hydrolase
MTQKTAVIYPFVVRPTHLDVFGHVNNAKYLEIFEEARWDLLEARGFGLKTIRERGLGPVVLEIRAQFKRELVDGDRCEVRTSVSSSRGKIFVLEQVLSLASGGEASCIAEVTGGLLDLQARKLVEPTAEWKAVLGAIG